MTPQLWRHNVLAASELRTLPLQEVQRTFRTVMDEVTGARWVPEAGQPAFSSNLLFISAFSVAVLMNPHLHERSLPLPAGRVMSQTRYFEALTRRNLSGAAPPASREANAA